jgi:hypothetical protein
MWQTEDAATSLSGVSSADEIAHRLAAAKDQDAAEVVTGFRVERLNEIAQISLLRHPSRLHI